MDLMKLLQTEQMPNKALSTKDSSEDLFEAEILKLSLKFEINF